jgi:thymidylate synthase (FAD)
MHFLDLRGKADAQIEIHQMCQMMMPHFEQWTPAVHNWYAKNRWGKARLAP